jgi:hypothetical protein
MILFSIFYFQKNKKVKWFFLLNKIIKYHHI